MNRKEWHKACEEAWAPRRYDNASREIQRSLKYNPDPKATVRHHLRDTEEQRKYNDEHYELWGFEIDENGNEHFEYGKYMIFMTEEEHVEIHNQSEETRAKRKKTLNTPETKKKISEASKRVWSDKNYHRAMCEKARASWTDDRKKKKSDSMIGELNHQYGKSGELSPNYGLKRSDKTRAKMSHSLKESYNNGNRARYRHISEEEHNRRSDAASGKNNGMYGKRHTDESRKKMSESCSHAMLGKHHTDKTKELLRIAHLAENLSDDTRRKLSASSKLIHELRKKAYNNYMLLYGNISYKEFASKFNNKQWEAFL